MLAIRRYLERFRRDASGAVLIEFALVITVLLILVFGVIDFGRLLFTANNLTAAAREGARFASVQPGPITGATTTSIQAEVVARTSVIGGSPVTANNVTVTYNPNAANPQSITVQVRDTFPFITPVAALLGLGNNRILATSSQFRWESANP